MELHGHVLAPDTASTASLDLPHHLMQPPSSVFGSAWRSGKHCIAFLWGGRLILERHSCCCGSAAVNVSYFPTCPGFCENAHAVTSKVTSPYRFPTFFNNASGHTYLPPPPCHLPLPKLATNLCMQMHAVTNVHDFEKRRRHKPTQKSTIEKSL